MLTIDINKVPKNPDTFSAYTPRDEVREALKLGKVINHIEKETKNSYMVEMKSGFWVTIPKKALIRR